MMPIQSYPSFSKMTQYGKSRVPDKIWQDLDPIRDNDAAVKEYGTQIFPSQSHLTHPVNNTL